MEKEHKKSKRTISQRRTQLRDTLWPDISDNELWLRTQRVGFTTIPRTMALMGRIIDHLSGKGIPLAATYLALWCWVFDEAFVEIRNPKELAYESGFNGPRGETTWRSRMRRLEELGFIKTKSGLLGEFQYVLILNPIKVIENHYSSNQKDLAYNALLGRLAQVGADDLDA
jgi:hypothetical protein